MKERISFFSVFVKHGERKNELVGNKKNDCDKDHDDNTNTDNGFDSNNKDDYENNQ